jgi:hypothetical protein
MIARDEADISDLQQRVDFTQIGVEHPIRTFNPLSASGPGPS